MARFLPWLLIFFLEICSCDWSYGVGPFAIIAPIANDTVGSLTCKGEDACIVPSVLDPSCPPEAWNLNELNITDTPDSYQILKHENDGDVFFSANPNGYFYQTFNSSDPGTHFQFRNISDNTAQLYSNNMDYVHVPHDGSIPDVTPYFSFYMYADIYTSYVPNTFYVTSTSIRLIPSTTTTTISVTSCLAARQVAHETPSATGIEQRGLDGDVFYNATTTVTLPPATTLQVVVSTGAVLVTETTTMVVTSCATSAPTETNSAPAETPHDKKSTGIIAGSVVAGVAVVALLAGAVIFLKVRKQRERRAQEGDTVIREISTDHSVSTKRYSALPKISSIYAASNNSNPIREMSAVCEVGNNGSAHGH